MSLINNAISFTKAMAVQIAAGCPMVSEEEAKERHGICGRCPELIVEEYRCGQCKCFLNLKIGLKTSQCPLGHWPDLMNEEVKNE